ncbi:MAG: hypothetical protein Q4P13_04785 [Psychrobacter sp.]|nr:hypothetical protein [Psychrobacter sp.]
MFAFIATLIVIWFVMWLFYKFMYPKPPARFMPQEGDVVTPRTCDFCGHELAEYRGVLEPKPNAHDHEEPNQKSEWFFCNYEHQADFHAGKTYQPYNQL